MRMSIFMISLFAVILTGPVHAEGISINPGMWEMTSTMTMSMMPQPTSTTVNECIEDDELSPESFNMEEDNPCNIQDVVIDGDTARWSISCPTESGQAMEGNWEITSNGDTITGSGAMSAEFAGQQMSFSMTWEGKRVGACE